MFVGSDDPMILLLEDVVNCNVPTTSNYKSLNVLLTILKNIRESPQQPKFRTLKKVNNTISSMLQLFGVSDLLSALGFEQGIENWHLDVTDEKVQQQISKVYNRLASRVAGLEVVGDLDPNIERIVKESKQKFESQRKYKQALVERMRMDRIQYKLAHGKKPVDKK